MTQVKIASMNVRGLANRLKRKKIMNYIKSKKIKIMCLQETHLQIEDEAMWQTESNTQIIFNHGESSSRGVCIMLDKNLKPIINKISRDESGRILILDLIVNDQKITVANIYAPNEDDPEFFMQLFKLLEQHDNQQLIIVGNFNLVMETSLDASNIERKNNSNALELCKQYFEQLMLVDIWRDLNPEKRLFTWSRAKPKFTASCIDMFIINYGLRAFSSPTIEPGFSTDHSLITLRITFEKQMRGQGYWKLNTSLLQDRQYLSFMNEKLNETVTAFYKETADIQWEEIKENLITESKAWSIERAAKNKQYYAKLVEKLEKIKNEIDNAKTTEADRMNLIKLQAKKVNELDNIIEKKTKGAIIRSRSNWYINAEKSSKYFLGLEKLKNSNKSMKILKSTDGKIITQQTEIINEQKLFYENLYTANTNTDFSYKNETNIKLTQIQRDKLDEALTYQEYTQAIHQMPHNKAPGLDGLPVEVYKVFFGIIGIKLYEALMYCVQQGCLSLSMRRGLLCLIPKKDRDPMILKNWRPLTLMNSDHKVFAKILANRMKPILVDIIGPQQCGYMEGRFIGLNIRKLIDAIEFIESEQLSALLVMVDFEKCFDTIEFHAIEGALRFYNFGEFFIKLVMMLYKGFHTAVTHNGFISKFFYPTRGCHQGCSVSGYLLLNAEILATKIANDPQIEKVPIQDHYIDPVLQFVDDMSVLMLPTETSLNRLIYIMEDFKHNTGLKTNFEKTTIFRVGNIRKQNHKYKVEKKFNWSDQGIYSLGMILDQSEEALKQNFSETMAKVSGILKTWKSRQLTLIGKIQVLNSLVGSLFTYKMQCLPCITENQALQLNGLLEDFIWNGRKPKIRLKILQASVSTGGQRLFDIRKRDKAIKVSWIPCIATMTHSQILLMDYFICTDIANAEFWQCNFSEKDIKYVCRAIGFWLDVIKAWANFNYQDKLELMEQILEQNIWYNSHIRIQNKPFYNKDMAQLGISKIIDLIDHRTNTFFSYDQFKSQYPCNIHFLTYYSIIYAIPKIWKNMILEADQFSLDLPDNKLDVILSVKQPSQMVYSKYIFDPTILTEVQQKWQDKYNIVLNEEQIKMGFDTKRLTTITKYRSFQYRLMHNAILLNDRLFYLGISNSQNCDFCNLCKENYRHLFLECTKIQHIWKAILDHFHIYDIEINFSNIAMNHLSEDKTSCINLIALVFKQNIYAMKCKKQKLNAPMIIEEIEFIKKLEQQQCTMQKAISKFNAKWSIIDQNENVINPVNDPFVLEYIQNL